MKEFWLQLLEKSCVFKDFFFFYSVETEPVLHTFVSMFYDEDMCTAADWWFLMNIIMTENSCISDLDIFFVCLLFVQKLHFVQIRTISN